MGPYSEWVSKDSTRLGGQTQVVRAFDLTGLAVSEFSKSVPQLLLHHEAVPELTVQPPLR